MSKTLPKIVLPDVRLGMTVDFPIRLETDDVTYCAIASLSRTAPLRVVTQSPHGLPDGWRAAIVDAQGQKETNAENVPPSDRDLHRLKVIDPTTVEFPEISSLSYAAHVAGTGALAFYAPKDLSGYTSASMDLKRSVKAPVTINLHTSKGTLEIDNTNKAIWLHLLDTTLNAAGVSPRQYVFDMELVRSGGRDAICSAESTVTVLPEVTTTA